MSEKKRLDVLLTERGLQESRQRAQAVIMSGEVFVNGQRVDKPGTAVAEDAQIELSYEPWSERFPKEHWKMPFRPDTVRHASWHGHPYLRCKMEPDTR